MAIHICNAQTLQDPKVYWSYCPSLAAGVIFVILYGSTACVHLAQSVYYKRRNATIITMGAVLETTAFILRLLVIHTLDLSQIYEAQFILILVAPMFMNAYDFVQLGALVNYCLPDKQLVGISGRKIAWCFVASDIIAFLIQIVGAVITTSTNNTTILAGLHIYTAGVALQQAFILCFCVLVYHFRKRMARECDPEKAKSLRTLLYTLYLSLSLISFRVLFRIIEFSSSNTSRISKMINRHEIFLYMFDCLPMFLALVIFNITHPGRIMTGLDSYWPKLTKEEKKVKKAGKKSQAEEKKREKIELKRMKQEEGILSVGS